MSHVMSHFDCWQAAPAGNDIALEGELETVANKGVALILARRFGWFANETIDSRVFTGCDGLTRGNEGSKA
ncbi:hypothetical protein B0E45_00700 [Sinorhizobium sp. A49]|nr:hypothetical protein B0E45_00700 [Sinorhizobium sp. A49]